MKTALYHQDGKEAIELVVLEEHSDGTIDLGKEAGEPALVIRCPVAEKPKFGHATLADHKPKKSAETDAEKKADAERKAAEKAAQKAAKAAADAATAKADADRKAADAEAQK